MLSSSSSFYRAGSLPGVMFESGQFDQAEFAPQKTALTYLVLLVIVGSIVYFAIVLVSEVYWMIKANSEGGKASRAEIAKKNKGRPDLRKASTFNPLDIITDDSQVNPMFQVRQRAAAGDNGDEVISDTLVALLAMDDTPTTMQWRAVQEGVKALQAANHATLKDNAEMKQLLASAKPAVQAAASVGRLRVPASGPVIAKTVKRTYAPMEVESASKADDSAAAAAVVLPNPRGAGALADADAAAGVQ